jgi:hypothetical protein
VCWSGRADRCAWQDYRLQRLRLGCRVEGPLLVLRGKVQLDVRGLQAGGQVLSRVVVAARGTSMVASLKIKADGPQLGLRFATTATRTREIGALRLRELALRFEQQRLRLQNQPRLRIALAEPAVELEPAQVAFLTPGPSGRLVLSGAYRARSRRRLRARIEADALRIAGAPAVSGEIVTALQPTQLAAVVGLLARAVMIISSASQLFLASGDDVLVTRARSTLRSGAWLIPDVLTL